MISPWIFGILSGAAVNLLALGLRKLLELKKRRKQLEAADEKRFQAVLESDSLKELGGYLDSAVGQFGVRDFAENEKVRERVTTFLGRLEDFVGLPEAVSAKPEKPVQEEPIQLPLADSELEKVEMRIEQGELWDALATLRRAIEIRLTNFARDRGVRIPSQPGAGRLVRLLIEREVLPPDVGKSLEYAIQVANRGVHGAEVGSDEAIFALRQTLRGLNRLELLHP